MDKITDLFQGLKERLNNPLIASFIIAWLIINWQVPIGLIFYGNETLAIDGYKSKIDLILKSYSSWFYVWLPLFSAIGYIIFMPVLKNLIQAYNTWKRRWGTLWNLSISKEGGIPISKYLGLRSIYIERTNQLQEIIKSESYYLKENSDINLRVNELQDEKNKLLSKQSEINENNNIRNLNGYWRIKHKKSFNNNEVQDRVMISNGEIHKIKHNAASDLLFKITSFAFNPLTTDVIFIFEDPLSKKTFFATLRPTENVKLEKLNSFTDGMITEMERE